MVFILNCVFADPLITFAVITYRYDKFSKSAYQSQDVRKKCPRNFA